jgi:predicted dehydrogenase
LAAVADILHDRAKEKAEIHQIANAYLPGELLCDPEIDLVINLTVPQAHEELNLEILNHQKHVYTEKPLALTREGAKKILQTAKQNGLRVGAAPDTFMSAPVQTAKKLLEENIIGDIVGINAICPLRGNEAWRPDSDFFYKTGAGPILDMAPYYFNIMIDIFGAFSSVTAMGRITWEKRIYTCEIRKGDTIDVEVPTHIESIYEMENGALFHLTNSFDITSSKTPYIEIYGGTGTMILPFPNFYSGDVLLSKKESEWEKVPQLSGYEGFRRGAAVADMAVCINNGGEHLANGEMAFHAVDIMNSLQESITSGKKINIKSTCPKPKGMWEREAIRK